MLAIPSAKFLKEFTIYAEQAADEKETFIIIYNDRYNGYCYGNSHYFRTW